MATMVLMLNLAACLVIWAAAMFYYLRHGVPEGAGQHYSQIALILIAVGAFAAGIADLRTQQLSLWAVAFRTGIAMVAARYLVRAWRRFREQSLGAPEQSASEPGVSKSASEQSPSTPEQSESEPERDGAEREPADRERDVCSRFGIPANADVQHAYDATVELEQAADAARAKFYAAVDAARQAVPLAERLVYAATARCECGAGMAFDPCGATAWDCSAIMLGTAVPAGQPGAVTHSDAMPFAFWSVLSERSPRADGRTTRPAVSP